MFIMNKINYYEIKFIYIQEPIMTLTRKRKSRSGKRPRI